MDGCGFDPQDQPAACFHLIECPSGKRYRSRLCVYLDLKSRKVIVAHSQMILIVKAIEWHLSSPVEEDYL